jgi:hypothetical protein
MKIIDKMGTVRELLHFFWENKLWWMIPVVVTVIIVAVLIVFAQAAPVVPFLYTTL